MPVRDLADIQRIEAEPLATRGLPRTTYEVFTASAQRWPDRKALSFFLTADTYQRASTWTYAELLAEITRAANAFHAFGVSADHPVAYVLPNLPETHFTIWGGEAAGVVLAVNPLLEPDLIVEILRAAKVRVLVTLAPFPGAELWSKLAPHLSALSELRVVALVDAMTYLGGEGGTAVAAAVASVPDAKFEIVDFRAAMQAQPADRLVVPRTITEHSVSSYFCTGGTTGAPKIAVRTHGNEIFDAWAAAQVFGEREEPRTYFCGLPLFHVNAQLATGLLPWMHGHHVLLATPEGYRGKNLDRALLGDRGALPHRDVLWCADDLCRPARGADRRQRHLEPRIRDLRRGADAGQVDRGVRSEDRPQDRRGLWADRGHLRLLPQSAGGQTPRRVDRPAPAIPADARRHPR